MLLGTLGNSYALGDADGGAGDDNVGGLVGSLVKFSIYASRATTIQNSYALGGVDGGDGADEVGRLFGSKETVIGSGTRNVTIKITSNYYNSDSDLDNGETIQTILDTEAVGKTRLELKALTATDTENDFTGDNNGWSADDWQFTDGISTPA